MAGTRQSGRTTARRARSRNGKRKTQTTRKGKSARARSRRPAATAGRATMVTRSRKAEKSLPEKVVDQAAETVKGLARAVRRVTAGS